MARIFVIDDDPGMRRTICRSLRRAGHFVITFPNGRDAVKRFAIDPPDLLITDIFMPETEGLEIISNARKLRPAMPIIAISGISIAPVDYLYIAKKLGADAALKKPFRLAELRNLVSQLLRQQRG